MICFPNAKINLGLHILRKRSDGYHDIESVLYPVPLEDVLEIRESEDLHFVATGIPIPGNTEENLCVKAYHLLKKEYDIPPVEIHLRKNIPMGGGLGGGSSDGAYMLKLLNDFFGMGLTVQELEQKAASLGSDCPFFIRNTPALATGTGTTLNALESFNLAKKYLVLLFPDVHSSTSEAYSGITPENRRHSIKEIISGDLLSWKQLLVNDFEKSIFPHYPALADLKMMLYNEGAIYASMTGSGAVIFGIFNEKVDLPTSTAHRWFNL